MSEVLAAGPERGPVRAPAWVRCLVPALATAALAGALLGGDAAPNGDQEPALAAAAPPGSSLVITDRRASLLDVGAGTVRPVAMPPRWASVFAFDPVVVGTTVVLRLGPEAGEVSGAHNRVVALDPAAAPGPVGAARSLGSAESVVAGRDGASAWLVRRSGGGRVARLVRLDGAVLVDSVPLPPGARVLSEVAAGLLVGPAWPTGTGRVAVIDVPTGQVRRDLISDALVHAATEHAVLWSSRPGVGAPLRRTAVATGAQEPVRLPDGVRRSGPAVLGPAGSVATVARDARGRTVLARLGAAGEGGDGGAQLAPLPSDLPAPELLAVDRRGVLYGYGGGRVLVLPAGSRQVYALPGVLPDVRAVAAG